ncbi:hypothetical protein LTR22_023409 [Elasticomyces elasticus]|nr:hypothetical protein LTR22_023409 [Elasticomyces elasticus]KAK4903668.1 hypothetical protein LTR49_026740 [Elasticomyces elasticus]
MAASTSEEQRYTATPPGATPMSGLDVYGHYRNRPPPDFFDIEPNIDRTPVNMPHVLSEDELPRFSYPPLGSAEDQIRLISLLQPEKSAEAGESMEPIQCTITVHTLSSAPVYEALSYTWGSMQRNTPISVVHQELGGTKTEEAVFATPQLVIALRRLRRHDSLRMLWIDQLCIDQDNMHEVGPQAPATSSLRALIPSMVSARMGFPGTGYEMINLIQDSRLKTLGTESTIPTNQAFLCKLFQVQRRVKCYDGRDRIFAFLAFQHGEGILSTAEAYQQPIQDIWQLAAEKIIMHSKSLDILAAVPGDSVEEDSPSWLPNWTNPFPYGPPLATPISKFKASRSIPHLPIASSHPRKLHVKGKIIDRVCDRLQFTTMGNPEGSGVSFFLYWEVNLQTVRGWLNGLRLGDYLPVARQNMGRDLLRTLLADGAMGTEQPLRRVDKYVNVLERSDEMRMLRERRKTLDPDQRNDVVNYERLEDLALVALGKKIFFTEQGALGLAPEAVKVGDVVAIVHGSKTPMVLREVEGVTGEYRVIGQCYLNGWMYGEGPRGIPGKDNCHPHNTWWEEEAEEIVFV